MKAKHKTRRALGALTAIGLVGFMGACSDVLEVQNPGAINDDQLGNASNAPSFSATATSDFQRMYDDIIFAGALLTDEGFNGHNFTQWIDIDLRVIDSGNSIINSDVYIPLQRARSSGEVLAERLKPALGAAAASNLDLAQTMAYGAYSTLLLGEYFCEAPVAVGSAPGDPAGVSLSSQQLWARALASFEEVIAIADANGTLPASSLARNDTRAAQLRNMARVGAARAALQLGNNAKAIEYASAVPAGFQMVSFYDTEKSYQENTLFSATTGTSRYLGTEARFLNLNDPRVRHNATAQGAHNPDVTLRVPRQSSSFSEFDPVATPNGALFTQKTDIRFATGLEARYIRAEAEGATATTRTLVNERRVVGGATALAATATDAEVMAELREQRSRDFYLAGTRLGDLRRYAARGVNDPRHVFPSGVYPTAARGNYGTATCFVIPTSETIGNPSL